MLNWPPGAALTFGLLTAALASLWLPRRRRSEWLWVPLSVAALTTAWVYEFVDWRGVMALAALAVAAYFSRRGRAAGPRLWAAVAVTLLLAALLMAHALPGFANPKVIDRVHLSPEAVPYSKYLNLDKAAAGLLLLALACGAVLEGGPNSRGSGFNERGSREGAGERGWRRVGRVVAVVAPITAAVLLALSWLLGYVRWEPGWPPILGFWLWTNLFFTCMAEEALFRGLVQYRLAAVLKGKPGGEMVALAIAAVLFGLAHAAGGWRYVALSTVAGAGYGFALHRSGRLEASIATHLVVNLLHFTCFTYPALAPIGD